MLLQHFANHRRYWDSNLVWVLFFFNCFLNGNGCRFLKNSLFNVSRLFAHMPLFPCWVQWSMEITMSYLSLYPSACQNVGTPKVMIEWRNTWRKEQQVNYCLINNGTKEMGYPRLKSLLSQPKSSFQSSINPLDFNPLDFSLQGA